MRAFLATIAVVACLATLAAAQNVGQCGTYRLLQNHGFPGNSLGIMTCIASLESGFNCNAGPHYNTDGTADYGLFQINSGYWCEGPHTRANGCGQPCGNMMNCDTNTQCALTVLKQQGYHAWATYNAHTDYCNSYHPNC